MYLGGLFYLFVYVELFRTRLKRSGLHLFPCTINCQSRAEHLFRYVDATFVERVKTRGGGFIIAAHNYGQGSSREHAAICPMYFGVKAILANSFARIHRDNLINYAVLPLTFVREADYEAVDAEDQLAIHDVRQRLEDGATTLIVHNHTQHTSIATSIKITLRQRQILLAGGLLRYVRKENHL